MKKFVLIFSVFALILTSCSSDDDNGSSEDSIIGTWTYNKTFTNGVEETLTECEKQETFIFRSDNTVDYKYYEEDTSANCLLEEDVSGTWSSNGNSAYILDFGAGPSTQTLTFENDTFYYDDVFGEDTYREVYIRN